MWLKNMICISDTKAQLFEQQLQKTSVDLHSYAWKTVIKGTVNLPHYRPRT